MGNKLAVASLSLLLAGCSALPPVDSVEARITKACHAFGLYRYAGTFAIYAIPGAALPIDLVMRGVDQVCADPARFAHDINTIAWLIRNSRADHE